MGIYYPRNTMQVNVANNELSQFRYQDPQPHPKRIRIAYKETQPVEAFFNVFPLYKYLQTSSYDKTCSHIAYQTVHSHQSGY